MTKRHLALDIWERELGKPYRWSGSDPIEGWDCSGLVNEGLKGVGIIGNADDYTANSLLNELFKNKPRLSKDQIKEGCLVFFANADNHIFHVEIVHWIIEGEIFTIGASGGGSATTTATMAAKQDAFVKVRPRKGWTYAIDPFSDD